MLNLGWFCVLCQIAFVSLVGWIMVMGSSKDPWKDISLTFPCPSLLNASWGMGLIHTLGWVDFVEKPFACWT